MKISVNGLHFIDLHYVLQDVLSAKLLMQLKPQLVDICMYFGKLVRPTVIYTYVSCSWLQAIIIERTRRSTVDNEFWCRKWTCHLTSLQSRVITAWVLFSSFISDLWWIGSWMTSRHLWWDAFWATLSMQCTQFLVFIHYDMWKARAMEDRPGI